jgi:hypothetical protein
VTRIHHLSVFREVAAASSVNQSNQRERPVFDLIVVPDHPAINRFH